MSTELLSCQYNNTSILQNIDNVLVDIESMIEKSDSLERLECESTDGVLTISDGKIQYVINRHRPSMQIWVASPNRGGLHFSYNSGQWISREGYEIFDLIKTEIYELFGIEIKL